MTDSTLNRYLASGTTTQRLAFVPDPPSPSSGPNPGYLWWDTDLQGEFAWDAGTSTWVATGGGGAFTLFSTTVTSGSQASVTVSSIPNTSKNMQIVITGRSTAAAALASVNLQINGDTGANYDGLSLQANGSSASVFSGGIGATANYIGNIPAASATSNVASNTTVTLTNYSGTTFQKSGFYQDSLKTGTASASNLYTETGSVWWRNTAAINSIKVFPSVGNWVDGSVIQVYLY